MSRYSATRYLNNVIIYSAICVGIAVLIYVLYGNDNCPYPVDSYNITLITNIQLTSDVYHAIGKLKEAKCAKANRILYEISNKSQNPLIRLHAATALVGEDNNKAYKALTDLVLLNEYMINDLIWSQIANIKEERSCKYLIEHMNTVDYMLRDQIKSYIRQIGTLCVDSHKEAKYFNSNDFVEQLMIIYNIDKFDDKNRSYYIQHLEGKMLSPIADIKAGAAYALGMLNSNESAMVLMQAAIQDRNPFVRAESIRALGKIKNISAVPILIEALKSDNPFVRISAAESMGDIGSINVVLELINSLDDKDINVKVAANDALEKILKCKVRDHKAIWSKELWLKWWEENKGRYKK